MSSGKARGLDGLAAEIFKHGGRILLENYLNSTVLFGNMKRFPKTSKMLP